jgi:hypothetical protein
MIQIPGDRNTARIAKVGFDPVMQGGWKHHHHTGLWLDSHFLRGGRS